MDSLHFSDRRNAGPRLLRVPMSVMAALALLATGCATVKPQDKELLADPAMTYGSGGEAAAQEDHVLVNREGAAGAGTTTGGGCGCN